MDQQEPTDLTPTRKIGAAGISGALVFIAVWVASRFGVDVPADVATAAAVLITAGVGYFIPDSQG
jgi:hypothetical protein